MNAPVPISIISGFLGAGKTTTLNHLLGQGIWPERSVVIVNDFGSVAIDQHLIEFHTGRIIALRNGCFCCALSGELKDGLISLLEGSWSPSHIIMETSGVSSLRNLRRILDEPALKEQISLMRTIVVADGTRILEMQRVFPVIRAQLEYADLILLNRRDLLDQPEAFRVRHCLEATYPKARICETEFGRIDPRRVLLSQPKGHDTLPPSAHLHDRWFSCRIEFDAGLNRVDLEGIVDRIQPVVERAKGFLPAHDGLYHIEISGPHREIKITDSILAASPDCHPTVVCLSNRPCADQLRAALKEFEGCMVVPEE